MRIYWNLAQVRVELTLRSNLPVIDSHGEDLFSNSQIRTFETGYEFIRTAITDDGDWILRSLSGEWEIFACKSYVDIGLFKAQVFPEIKNNAKWSVSDETEEIDS